MSSTRKPRTQKDDSPNIPDGLDLMERRRKCVKNMYTAINKEFETGKQWAEKQKAYRIALARKTAELRDSGCTTAALSAMSKGDPDIATLEYEMEVAAAEREQYCERVNAYKADANLTEAQIQREWGKSK